MKNWDWTYGLTLGSTWMLIMLVIIQIDNWISLNPWPENIVLLGGTLLTGTLIILRVAYKNRER